MVAVRHMLLEVWVVQDTDLPIAASDYQMVRPKYVIVLLDERTSKLIFYCR